MGDVTMADLRDALNACQRRQMEVLHERDQARAALNAVRALCDEAYANPLRGAVVFAADLRAALNRAGP
jgi:hypothetical protein